MKCNYHAITIEKININESDRLYTFYTLESGLLRVPAKSIRKVRSKLASQVEDFVFSNITIAQGYGNGILAGAIVEHYFTDLHEDYYSMICLDNIRSIFLSIIQENEEDAKIFELFVQYLQELNKLAKQNENVIQIDWLTNAFVIKLFILLGYKFCIGGCFECKTRITEQNYGFSAQDGGILCKNCVRGKSFCYVNSDTLKAIRIIYSNELKFLMKVNVNNDVNRQLQNISINIEKWIMR
jgi:DNA repair protein RecO (recombination protein O)